MIFSFHLQRLLNFPHQKTLKLLTPLIGSQNFNQNSEKHLSILRKEKFSVYLFYCNNLKCLCLIKWKRKKNICLLPRHMMAYLNKIKSDDSKSVRGIILASQELEICVSHIYVQGKYCNEAVLHIWYRTSFCIHLGILTYSCNLILVTHSLEQSGHWRKL